MSKLSKLFLQISFVLILSSTIHSTYALGINDGLVGWWKFDEGSGLSAVDSSGNNNTGTLANGAAFDSFGKRAGSVLFASGDLVSVPSSASITYGSSFSIMAWVYSLSTAGNQRILFKFSGSTGYLLRQQNGDIGLFVRSVSDGLTSVGWTGLVVNKWTHIAGTYNGTTLRLYVNGVEVANGARTIGPDSGVDLYIGNQSDGTLAWNGYIDDVRIYNRTLTASEIDMLANNRNQISNSQINNGQVK